MATSSILHDVVIDDEAGVQRLVEALEASKAFADAGGRRPRPVHRHLTGDELRAFLDRIRIVGSVRVQGADEHLHVQ